MTYRLDFSKDPEDALRGSANERVEDAIAQLDEGFSDDPTGAVHEARKDIKRARSLLRLYRGPLGSSTYRRENHELRDAGRELSAIRDEDVIGVTVAALAERFAGQLPTSTFDALRERLDGQEAAARSRELAVQGARDRLARVLARIEGWDTGGADELAVVAGLRRSYARGRKALERSLRGPSDERLHEWRKRVKDLRYQQQLLRPVWPAILSAQAKAAKELADLLGDDHDLSMFEQRIRDCDEPIVERDEVLALIERRRNELREQAFDLGGRIYAETPKRFTRRIARYLRSVSAGSGSTSVP
jgi:CHAD domain-containing protein